MKTYSLILSHKQQEVVSVACSLYAQVCKGQLNLAVGFLPYRDATNDPSFIKSRGNFVDYLKENLTEILAEGCDGLYNGCEKTPEHSDVSYSIYTKMLPFVVKPRKTLPFKFTEKEIQVISKACDLYSRLLMGQFNVIFDNLPLRREVDYGKIWEIRDGVTKLLREVLIHGIDGWASSLGVGSPDLHPNANIAVDIHHVIRHKLSWERAVENGVVDSESSQRKWPEMMFVSYDNPFHWGTEPLCLLTKITPELQEK
jgi:hypothetical protein